MIQLSPEEIDEVVAALEPLDEWDELDLEGFRTQAAYGFSGRDFRVFAKTTVRLDERLVLVHPAPGDARPLRLTAPDERRLARVQDDLDRLRARRHRAQVAQECAQPLRLAIEDALELTRAVGDCCGHVLRGSADVITASERGLEAENLHCGGGLTVCVSSRLELSTFQEPDELQAGQLAAARARLEPLRRRALPDLRLEALSEPPLRPSALAEESMGLSR